MRAFSAANPEGGAPLRIMVRHDFGLEVILRPLVTEYRRRSFLGLDWLNFFLADVRDGLGSYLAIYLLVAKAIMKI